MIAVVYGTRPEAIKLQPVVAALRGKGASVRVICTGQHRELLAATTLQADIDLGVMSREPSEVIGKVLARLPAELAGARLVLVQGDTASAFAGALAAFHMRLPLGHVEAGLRTDDLSSPFPEEGYRQCIDRLATRLYAPTRGSRRALIFERVNGVVIVTGNTGVDAALDVLREGRGTPHGNFPFILATMHRREAFGLPMGKVVRALGRLARSGLGVLIPVHPNPEAALAVAAIRDIPGVSLVQPLSHADLVQTMRKALCVVTDSGGIQEDGAALGVPVLVAREATERFEGIGAGSAMLVGFDEEKIVTEVTRLWADKSHRDHMATPRPVYGDGLASARIASDVLLQVSDQ